MDDVSKAREFHVASSDGVDIGCHLEGAGPPLVMVHGVAIDHSCFDRARHALARHFTLYLMDRRGRGLSGDGAGWSLVREFDDVAAVIDAIARTRAGPVNLFGHSLGGLCALEAALRTGNVRRLFLYDPALPRKPRPEALIKMADRLQSILDTTGDREKVIEAHLMEWTKISPESFARQKADRARWARRLDWAHTIPREYKATESFPLDMDRYGAVVVPTRIMVGETSSEGLQASARMVADAVPDADLIVLGGAAHYGFTTATDAFVAAVRDFFLEDASHG